MNNEDALHGAFEAAIRYMGGVDRRVVIPPDGAIAALANFKEPMPEGPSNAVSVIAELDRIGSPATVATTGGRFFRFLGGCGLPVTGAANWLASAWDQNAGTWVLSPIAAELEEVAANWLLDIFDLPRDATGGFVTGSTTGAH